MSAPNHHPDTDQYQNYYEKKRIAIVMEEKNNSKIIVFPSLTTKGSSDEWLKIGGNSAFFYKYLVAPRLNKKPPTIHQDADLNYRFKTGIIAIHWKNALIKNMESLGYTYKEESGLLIFNLNHTFTLAEIKKLHGKEKESREKTNQILKPSYSIPELYQVFLKLAQTLPNKIRKMDSFYRENYGIKLNESLIKLFELYIQVVNKSLSIDVAKQALLTNLDTINAILIIINENRALDYSTEQRLGGLLNEARQIIDSKLK